MKGIRSWVRSYFGFTRNQTNGFIILMPLMLLILFSQPLYRWIAAESFEGPVENTTLLDSLMASMEITKPDSIQSKSISLFRFDPNQATQDELTSLGFEKFLSGRIINYRSKGGRFKIKEDLLRIYGMDSTLYLRLEAYIDLPVSIEKIAEPKSQSDKFYNTVFDINLADTIQLKSIRGIGTKLSNRIVAYRDLLGGFVRMEQLQEVWGLDSTLVNVLQSKSLISEDFEPVRININTSAEAELSRHPYLNSKIGKAIIAYRFQHGSFKEIDDLLTIKLIDPKTLSKIKPYLTVE